MTARKLVVRRGRSSQPQFSRGYFPFTNAFRFSFDGLSWRRETSRSLTPYMCSCIFRSDQIIFSPGIISVQNVCLVIMITRSFPRKLILSDNMLNWFFLFVVIRMFSLEANSFILVLTQIDTLQQPSWKIHILMFLSIFNVKPSCFLQNHTVR